MSHLQFADQEGQRGLIVALLEMLKVSSIAHEELKEHTAYQAQLLKCLQTFMSHDEGLVKKDCMR